MDEKIKDLLRNYDDYRIAVLTKRKEWFKRFDHLLRKFLKQYPEPYLIELFEGNFDLDTLTKLCKNIKSEYLKDEVCLNPCKTNLRKIYRIEDLLVGNDKTKFIVRIVSLKKTFFYETPKYYCAIKRKKITDIYDKKMFFSTIDGAKQSFIDYYESCIENYTKELQLKIEKVKELE